MMRRNRYQWPDASWRNASWVPPSSVWADDTHPSTAPPPPQAAVNITLQAWRKKLADGSTAAVAFNRGTKAQNITLTAEMLGLGLDQRSGGGAGGGTEPKTAAAAGQQVRDLWLHQDMGDFGAHGYTAVVGAHDVVAIRISPAAAATAAQRIA
jgi:hypothetical protein